MIGIGLGLTVQRPAWTPQRLSSLTAWYDPRPGYVYQDAAGTTAAGVGDPVGYLTDRSGNGYHATQSTTASKPTLQQDAEGRYYLAFDGTDDFLVLPASPLDALDSATVGAGVFVTTVSGTGSNANAILQNKGTASTSDPGFQLSLPENLWTEANDGVIGDPGREVSSPNTVSVDTPAVGIGEFDSAEVVAWLNGTGATQSGARGTVDGDHAMAIGALYTGSNSFHHLSGGIYALVACTPRIAATDRQRIERYLANRAGVSL